MKVCFIAGTLGCGGAEKQLFFMLRALKSEGVHTKLLCLTKGERYENEIQDLGVDVEWVGSNPSRLYRLLATVEAVKRHRPDILQSAHFYTNIYSAAVGRVFRIPSIGAIRNDVTSEIAANPRFGTILLRSPQHMIANSKLGLERAISRGVKPTRIDFLPNVVQESAVENDEPRSNKALNIIFVGRLVRQKRPELFIDMASQLCREIKVTDLIFRVVGDGPERSVLGNLAVSRGLSSEQLEFVGEQVDMEPIYRNADILVLTSEHEGTPNVILEAMAFGIPVVATRTGGVPEVLGEKCGLMVDPSDSQGLLSAVKLLIGDAQLRESMGRHGRDYVANNHSLGSLKRRLTGIYNKLLFRR